jgi:hypothetical protein
MEYPILWIVLFINVVVSGWLTLRDTAAVVLLAGSLVAFLLVATNNLA